MHLDAACNALHLDAACNADLQESWGICYFRSEELASAAWDKQVVFHNGWVAVFRWVSKS